MARAWFGGTASDFLYDATATGNLHLDSGVVTFWDAETSGTQYTDLLLNASPVTSITAPTTGRPPRFQGPDNIYEMWADAGGARVLMISSTIGGATNAATAGFVSGAGATKDAVDARVAVGTARVAAAGVNVRDATYGATGNGSTDDTAAFTAAITAAGQGGRVFVPPGRYKVTSGLTLPVWCKIEGTASNLGSGSTANTELLFTTLTGSTTAITCGSESQIDNLVVRGPGYSVGTVKGVSCATSRFHRLSVVEFNTNLLATAGYYLGLNEVELLRGATNLKLVGDYNVDMYGSRMDCTNGAGYGVGINAGTVRGLNIYGGAIEAYATGIIVGAASQVKLSGVYMESLAASCIGIDGHSIAGLTLSVEDCFIYLDNHNIWLRTDGSTNVALRGRSNYFVASSGSSTSPTAYYFTPGQDVDLDGDNWFEVVKAGSVYADTSSGTVLGARVRIGWPVGTSATYGSTNNPVMTDSRPRIVPQTDQTLASNGAVTFNAAAENQRCILQANATSSTITNAVNGQVVSITFQQDATGSRTYVWPTACNFIGNAAPSGTAASTRNTCTFRYDSSTGKFYEIYGRATAVPV